MATNKRDFNLHIRAKDETGPGVRSAQSALERLAAAQKRTAGRRDAYAGAVQSAKDLRAAYDEAATAAQRAGERIGNAARPSKKMRDELAATREAARAAKQEYIAAEGAVRRFTNTGFAGFDRFAASGKKFESATRAQARAQDELANSYRRTEAAAARAQGAQRRGRGGGGLSGDIVDAITTRNERGPLGLRPYELTNLGYQVNDLITQIASGTSPMQAFAQQGGQIAQIFPAATGALLRMIPVIGLLGLALAPTITKIMQANNEARRLSEAEAILRRSGEAATYSAPQLAAFAKRLEDIGLKSKDATALVSLFVREAIDPSYLDAFARSSQQLAKAMGTDVATAAEKVTQAFAGNSDAVLALDDEINFLTDSERAHIEALKESGRESDVRTEAFAIFEQRYGEMADKMAGPWTQILNDFGDAWQNFADWVGSDEVWENTKKELGAIANMISQITGMLPGARRAGMAAIQTEISNNARRQGELTASRNSALARNSPVVPQIGRRLTALQQERQVLETRLALARSQERGGILSTSPVDARTNDTTRDPQAPAPGRKTRGGGRDRGASEAERLAKQQAEFVAQLEAENAAREFQLSLLDETERQQQILTAMRAAEISAERVGLELTSAQRDEIVRTTSALYDRQQVLAGEQVLEQARLELARQRGEVEDRNAFIARMTAENMKNATDAQKAAYAVILGQMYDMEAVTRRRTELETALAAQESIRAELLTQLSAAAETGDLTRVALIEEQLVGVNANLMLAIDQMIAFWTATGGPESEVALLRLNGVRTALVNAGNQAVVTGKQMNDMIAQGGANALDRFAQLAVETGDAFDSARQAFLGFAADFLRQIAIMIAQQAILNALGAGQSGGGGKGGLLSGLVNGLFGGGGKSVPVKHVGGLVGQGGGYRTVSPAAFAGATRYHTGGMVGMRPDEVPIIAQRNEEVLTEADPRHRSNGGLGGRGGGVKVVNVFDPAEALERGLATESGERTVMNFFRRNSGAIKAVLG